MVRFRIQVELNGERLVAMTSTEKNEPTPEMREMANLMRLAFSADKFKFTVTQETTTTTTTKILV
jgi:hypothetical protein